MRSFKDIFRFRHKKKLTEDEEKIVALTTRVLTKGTKKTKRQIAVILQELID